MTACPEGQKTASHNHFGISGSDAYPDSLSGSGVSGFSTQASGSTTGCLQMSFSPVRPVQLRVLSPKRVTVRLVLAVRKPQSLKLLAVVPVHAKPVPELVQLKPALQQLRPRVPTGWKTSSTKDSQLPIPTQVVTRSSGMSHPKEKYLLLRSCSE